jgi:hypothetical protein
LSNPFEAARKAVSPPATKGISQKQPDEFRKGLETLINKHSKENGSDTRDFVLAQYLIDCLAAFDKAVKQRERLAGRKVGSWRKT